MEATSEGCCVVTRVFQIVNIVQAMRFFVHTIQKLLVCTFDKLSHHF